MNKQTKTLYEHIDSLTFNSLGKVVGSSSLFSLPKNKSLILCYHSVSNSGWRFSTSPTQFEKHIKFLKKNFTIISLAEALKGTAGVCITFDDGYKDVFTVAYPILKKHGLTAAVFIIGNTKSVNKLTTQPSLKFMTTKQIQVLQRNNWEIGYHTNTHQNLCEINIEEAYQEIVASKKTTEKILGKKLKYFAYPLGMYNSSILSLVKKAGFSAAFTINGGFVNTTNKLTIPRVALEGAITYRYFVGLISFVGIRVNQAFITALQLKEHIRLSLTSGTPALK